MVLTFNTTKLAQKNLKAAIHPRDKTIRPQCVIKSWNQNIMNSLMNLKKTGIELY